MDQSSNGAELYSALATITIPDTVPDCPSRINDLFPTIASFWKALDPSSEDDMRGLVSGLIAGLSSLEHSNAMTALSTDDLSLKFIGSVDEEFSNNSEVCLAELEVWYPTFSDLIERAETSTFYKYLACGLYCIHKAIRTKFATSYTLRVAEDGMRARMQQAKPAPVEIKQEAPVHVQFKPKPTSSDPVLAILSKLSVVSQVPGVSFVIITDEAQSYVSVRCPNGLTVKELTSIGSIFEDKGQIFCENNVISILVPIF